MEIRDRVRELRRVPASSIKPHPLNWRVHNDAQREALRGVLQRLGFAGAVLAVERDGALLCCDGHLRSEEMGQREVPVLVLDLDDDEVKTLLLTFDPIGGMATANKARLDELLASYSQQTAALDPALLNGMQKSLDEMLKNVAKTAGSAWGKQNTEVVEDEIPEPPKNPITKPGDLWLLGEHRLICGDSTDGETIARLMDGQKADLLFTSPPYAQQRDYDAAKKHVQHWDHLMQGVFQHAKTVMADDGQVLVNLGLVHRDGEWLPYWDGWIEWMRGQGWKRFGWYVWDQGFGLPGDWNGRLGPSHEFVFHFNRIAKHPAKWVDKLEESICINHGKGMRQKDGKVQQETTSPEASLQRTKIPDSVMRVNRNSTMDRQARAGHPATFPLGFASYALKSWPGAVFEPFSGAGTTLCAATQLQTGPCYASELDPRYVDVAIARWEKLTGQKAKKAGTT